MHMKHTQDSADEQQACLEGNTEQSYVFTDCSAINTYEILRT